MRRLILGGGLLAVVMWGWAEDPDIPVPGEPQCYRTIIGNKCCDDHVLSWVMCGDPPAQCNLEEEFCDHLLSTEPSMSGHKNIENAPCQKHTIFRVCSQNGVCLYDHTAHQVVLNGTQETGDVCTSVPK